MRENTFPARLPQRIVDGYVLYAPVVTYDLGGHTMVFVSGLLARSPEGAIVGKGDMGAQIRQVGENLKASLESVGATLENLVRTCTFVTDIEAFFKHVAVRHEYFGPGLPTSTTVEVRRLSNPDFMVEVEGFAIIPSAQHHKEQP